MRFDVFVVGGRENFRLRKVHSEVRHLFRPLVDEKYHEVALRVVGYHPVSDVFQERRLSGAGRGDYQAARPLSYRAENVHYARAHPLLLSLEAQFFLGRYCREILELLDFPALGARQPVDGLDEAHFGVWVPRGAVRLCLYELPLLDVETLYELLWRVRVGIAHFSRARRVEQNAVVVRSRGENARDFHYFKVFVFHFVGAVARRVICAVCGQSAIVRKKIPPAGCGGGETVPPQCRRVRIKICDLTNRGRGVSFFTSDILTPNGARWQSFFWA